MDSPELIPPGENGVTIRLSSGIVVRLERERASDGCFSGNIDVTYEADGASVTPSQVADELATLADKERQTARFHAHRYLQLGHVSDCLRCMEPPKPKTIDPATVRVPDSLPDDLA